MYFALVPSRTVAPTRQPLPSIVAFTNGTPASFTERMMPLPFTSNAPALVATVKSPPSADTISASTGAPGICSPVQAAFAVSESTSSAAMVSRWRFTSSVPQLRAQIHAVPAVRRQVGNARALVAEDRIPGGQQHLFVEPVAH